MAYSPEQVVDYKERENTPGKEDASKGAMADLGLLGVGDEGGFRTQETARVEGHLIAAKDKFSELGTPLTSRRLAFQGPDIDPYLRYALQVDVANVMKELRELLGLEPLEIGTSQVVSKSQPALPEDVESFDAEGKVL